MAAATVYNRLDTQFQRSEDAANRIRERIAAVEDVADDLFDEWEESLDPVLANLRDNVLYLRHNLNSRAVGRHGMTVAQLPSDSLTSDLLLV